MDYPYVRFVRHSLSEDEAAELTRVDELAELLFEHLAMRAGAIDQVHVHRAGSSAVQRIVSELLVENLGFGEEVVIAPEDGLVTHARPDFYYRLVGQRGILAEVERGGTVTNNHDLKDVWKAHISPNAQHLFLIVPIANWNALGGPRERPYARVVKRVGAFFGDPRREIDVLSAHVFGYGRGA